MKAELHTIARRVVWFQSSEETLSDPIYFLCYWMRYGLPEELAIIQQHYTAKDFQHALENAYPGILDARSWAYWNLKYFNDSSRSMPKREFPEESG